MQSAVIPASFGPRVTLNFSAPALSTGAAGEFGPALRGPNAPKSYTPERSGVFAAGPDAGALETAAPATVTVTDWVSTWSFTPFTVSVYLVVTVGNTWRLPRALTRPRPGSITIPVGFSVAHSSVTGAPDWTEAGFAVNESRRAGNWRAL